MNGGKRAEATAWGSGSLMVLAAAVLWGTTGTAQAFAPPGADPLSVGAVRIGLGGLAMLAFAAFRGDLHGLRGWSPVATGFAALAVAAYQPLFFTGVSVTGVAVGTVAAIGSAPVWAGLIGLVFGGQRPTARWGIATALAVIGCALLLGSAGGVSVDPLGVLLCLAAGGGYVAFATLAKGLFASKLQAAVMGVIFSLGALVLLPALLFATDLSWLTNPRGALVAAELGIFATAVAYLLFARGLFRVPVATAATLSLAEPLTAATLGILVLGERLTPVGIVGVGLLLSGLLLTSVGDRSNKGPSRDG